MLTMRPHRSTKLFKEIFAKADLTLVREELQRGFPEELFGVWMWVTRAPSRPPLFTRGGQAESVCLAGGRFVEPINEREAANQAIAGKHGRCGALAKTAPTATARKAGTLLSLTHIVE